MVAEDESPQAPQAARSSVRMRSSAWTFASQVGKTALSVPVGILLARTLGPSGKGTVSVVQTIAAVTVAILNLGMPSAVLWLAARGRTTGRSAVTLGAMFSAAALALSGVAILVFGPTATAQRFGLSNPWLLGLAFVAIGYSMIGYFIDYYLLGRGAIRLMSTVDVATLMAQLVGMVVLMLLHRMTIANALFVWLAVGFSATVWKGVRALRSDGPGQTRWGALALWSEGRVYALKAWLGNTVSMLSLRQDMLILAALAGPREVGVYSIAVTAAELAWYVPGALQSVATVKFSAEGDSTELVERMNRSVWPFTLVFAIFVFLLAAPLIPLVYGGVFRASVQPLALLLPGIVATSMSIALAAWLTGQGHPQDPAIGNAVNMCVNLAANFALIPRLGASGAALASTISYSAASGLIIWRFKARTGARLVDILVPRASDMRMMFGIVRTAFVERFRPGDAGGNADG